MKAKKQSSKTKRKSAKRPLAARRATSVKSPAPRRRPSLTGRRRHASSQARRSVSRRKTLPRKSRVRIPPVLLEGDRPAAPRLSGPGGKSARGKVAPAAEIELAELPEAYGTGRLFVTSRDPHWLFAHWDFTREQQRRYNALSAHGHLVLRTYLGSLEGQPVSELHVHPESRHWFVHVEQAATRYVTELGYYRRDGQWARVAASATTLTPPNTPSADTAVAFATIPVDTPFEDLRKEVRQGIASELPLAEAWEQLRQRAEAGRPADVLATGAELTPEQVQTLAELIRLDTSPCGWMDSLEIAELIQGHRQPEGGISSPGGGESALQASPVGGEYVSSPVGGLQPGAKSFWLNVNAELVIYGATEPDAEVAICGRKLDLQPDGSFSCRFTLPDGQHELVVTAVAADGSEGRAAELKFTRATKSVGEVGAQPQEPALLPPAAENV